MLHDVFGHPHADIAAMLDRSPVAIRQISRRARRHLDERRGRNVPDGDQQRAVTDAFLAACAGGDLSTMLALLAPDVTFTGDGGGIATVIRRPVRGAERIAKMFLGFWRTGQARRLSVDVVEVNSAPGLWVRDGDVTDSVICLEVVDGRIIAIRVVRNPAKLVGFERLNVSPPVRGLADRATDA